MSLGVVEAAYASQLLDVDGQSHFRSVVGQMMWLSTQSRADLSFGTSWSARRNGKATKEDARFLNQVVKMAKDHKDAGLFYPRGSVDLATATILVFADSAFANVESVKSQYGQIVAVTNAPDDYVKGRYDKGIVLSWGSATVKRVVRSTLAAEAYAVSEGVESGEFLRFVFGEILEPTLTPESVAESPPTKNAKYVIPHICG